MNTMEHDAAALATRELERIATAARNSNGCIEPESDERDYSTAIVGAAVILASLIVIALAVWPVN